MKISVEEFKAEMIGKIQAFRDKIEIRIEELEKEIEKDGKQILKLALKLAYPSSKENLKKIEEIGLAKTYREKEIEVLREVLKLEIEMPTIEIS